MILAFVDGAMEFDKALEADHRINSVWRHRIGKYV